MAISIILYIINNKYNIIYIERKCKCPQVSLSRVGVSRDVMRFYNDNNNKIV